MTLEKKLDVPVATRVKSISVVATNLQIYTTCTISLGIPAN